MEEVTEQPEDMGVASPAPIGLSIVMFMGAFSVVLWGMNLLFGRKPYN